MQIYFVTSYGNPEDGPDGPDTNFLVSASGLVACIDIAERFLSSAGTHPDAIKVLGENSAIAEERVIHGPWVAVSTLAGEFMDHYREYSWGPFPRIE